MHEKKKGTKEKAEEIHIYTQGHAGLKRCYWAFDFGLYHSTQLHMRREKEV